MRSDVETLVLTGSDIANCLSPEHCREAVADAFRLLAQGRVPAPRSIGFESPGGSFHAKAALFDAGRPRFVAKLNGNFPGNPARSGLPTIQGVLVLADAADGRPLAVMDSAALTAVRTAAASAVAALHLARRDATTTAIVGCGLQGTAHVDALLALREILEFRLFDAEPSRARQLATRITTRSPATVRVADSVRAATVDAGIVVTCTSGAEFVLAAQDVAAGVFVAAVGADNPHKREIHPSLMARARVVVDDLAQCAAGGDLHHAIASGAMVAGNVHATLGEVVAGTRPGRERDTDVFLFDSTGIAIEDAAAADLAYENAVALRLGRRVSFAS